MSCDLQCPQHIYNKYAPNNNPQCGTDNPYLCYGGIPVGGCNSDPNFWTQNRGCSNCCNMNLGPAPKPAPKPTPKPTPKPIVRFGPSLKTCIDHLGCTTDPAKIISNATGREGKNSANDYGCTLNDVKNGEPPAHLDSFGGGDLPGSRICEMQDYCQSVANSQWPGYKIGTVFNDYIVDRDGELVNVCNKVSQDWSPYWWEIWAETKGKLGCNIDPFPDECRQYTYRGMPRCMFTDTNPNLDFEGMDGAVGFCGWNPNIPDNPDYPDNPRLNPNAECMPFIGNCECPDVDDELTTQCKQKYPQIRCDCNPLCKDHMDWITPANNDLNQNNEDLADIYLDKIKLEPNLAAN